MSSSLFTKIYKPIHMINNQCLRFYMSKPTILFIPMPIKNFNYESMDEFLLNANKIDINKFYKEVYKKTNNIIKNDEQIYIKTCGIDSKKQSHVQISNRPFDTDYGDELDVF